MGLFPLLIGVALFAVFLWLEVRVLRRAGYSGWWVLITFVPLVNIVMIWVFAFSTWPATRRADNNVEKVFE